MVCEDVGWTHLTQDTAHCRALIKVHWPSGSIRDGDFLALISDCWFLQIVSVELVLGQLSDFSRTLELVIGHRNHCPPDSFQVLSHLLLYNISII
jgi:hypothetical protein